MPVTTKKEHCMVCGTPLEYLTTTKETACTVCGGRVLTHIRCPEGHVLCDACHGREARKTIEDMAAAETCPDPMEIAERMLDHPAVPMLSCDHAFIAAGALITSLRNSPYGASLPAQALREVFDRTEQQARGGFCGLTGVCGITPAIGAVLSVYLGARCGSDREQRIVMDAVTRVSRAIADLTGPSCCKAYVRAAVRTGADVFAEAFGIALPVKNETPACGHAERHPHGCREERCPYYRRPSKDIFAEGIWLPGTLCVT